MPRELTIDDANEDEIRSALVALAPGEALVLAGDGPERTRLEVRRRKSAAPHTVTGFLQADHERLDAIIPDVERLVDAGSFPEAAARFDEFRCGLAWHIDSMKEEKMLYPMTDRAIDTVEAQERFVTRLAKS